MPSSILVGFVWQFLGRGIFLPPPSAVRDQTRKGPSWIALRWLTVSSFHVMHAFRSESTLYSCLNVKELFARNRRDIWSLSDCNWARTHNHLVLKETLNHLAKLAKWLSCVVSTYLDGAFDSMFLSCHVLVLEWIHTL